MDHDIYKILTFSPSPAVTWATKLAPGDKKFPSRTSSITIACKSFNCFLLNFLPWWDCATTQESIITRH